MRLVVTLRTRDQADLADANVAFHLAAGADFVLATDHGSVDGTRDVLGAYETTGRLRLICRDDERYVPGQWVDEMAQLALREHDADWVIHADADEFWWPSGGDLKEVLAAIPERFGVLFCPWRHFVPRSDDRGHFAERLIVRTRARAPWTRPEDPFHPNVNVAHRAHRDVRVRPGNHDVEGPLLVLRGWFPIEVLHFPLRTRRQAEEKFAAWSRHRAALDGIAPHVDAAGVALGLDAFGSYYGRYLVDDARLATGLAEGSYVVDTRLRDTLRTLAGGDGPIRSDHAFHSERSGARLRFRARTPLESADLADDVTVLPDPASRLERRVEMLELRLAHAERSRLVARRARSLVSARG